MKERKYYAHSLPRTRTVQGLPGTPPEKWQSLEGHLRNTARLAKQSAAPFIYLA